jgi:hypothetical protein
MNSKKTLSLGTLLRWFVCAVLVAIPFALYVTSHELKKTEPQRSAAARAAHQVAAAEYDKKHPWCTQEVSYAVKDSTGVVIRTDKREEKIRCSPDLEAIKAHEARMSANDKLIQILSIAVPALGFLLTLALSRRG